MIGHHVVRVLSMNQDTRMLSAPSGWKPFGFAIDEDGNFIIATREWVREEPDAREHE